MTATAPATPTAPAPDPATTPFPPPPTNGGTTAPPANGGATPQSAGDGGGVVNPLVTVVPDYFPFGITDLWVYSLVVGTDLPGTGVHVPAGRTFELSPTEDQNELTGYNGVVATNASGTASDVTLEFGGLSLEVMAAIGGGSIVESGTAPAVTRTLDVGSAGVARPSVMVVGRALADNYGDVWIKAWKVKFELPGVAMAESEYLVTSVDGHAIRNVSGKLISYIDHQTPTPLTSAAPA